MASKEKVHSNRDEGKEKQELEKGGSGPALLERPYVQPAEPYFRSL